MLSLPRITQKPHHVPPSPSPSHPLCRGANIDPEKSWVPSVPIQKDDGCPTLSSSFSDHNGQEKAHFTPCPWSHIHTHQRWNKNISHVSITGGEAAHHTRMQEHVSTCVPQSKMFTICSALQQFLLFHFLKSWSRFSQPGRGRGLGNCLKNTARKLWTWSKPAKSSQLGRHILSSGI